jgi:hypothetical protein
MSVNEMLGQFVVLSQVHVINSDVLRQVVSADVVHNLPMTEERGNVYRLGDDAESPLLQLLFAFGVGLMELPPRR